MSISYILRLPFTVPDRYRINVVDNKKILSSYYCELKEDSGQYSLTVFDISSEEEAKKFMQKLQLGMIWAGLDLKMSFLCSFAPQQVAHFDDPEKAGRNLMLGRPVDAAIDGAQPAIYEHDLRLAHLRAGSVSIIIGMSSERILDAIEHGLQETSSRCSPLEGRQKTAFDLFSLANIQENPTSQFLLRCVALETLVPSAKPCSDAVINLVDKWLKELEDAGFAASEKESLRGSIAFLKTVSHGQRIRDFARQTLNAEQLNAQPDIVEKLIKGYSARGRFLHDGIGVDGQVMTDFRDAVSILLKAVLRMPG